MRGELLWVCVVAMLGCGGPVGPEGPQGPEGPMGQEGQPGPQGDAGTSWYTSRDDVYCKREIVRTTTGGFSYSALCESGDLGLTGSCDTENEGHFPFEDLAVTTSHQGSFANNPASPTFAAAWECRFEWRAGAQAPPPAWPGTTAEVCCIKRR